ncbi:carbohydrate sulfotransferase 1-like [Mercenaria mercenaria]|uniref:carbohydrate sulfotransferase 1-like n=1 Tax=Mercenaria mercenaria TaxID=6596 RepID=UPI00234F82A7|nr:carbohydrate sulfotransferase 1-like [Mercenaria mercenaria]
MASKTFAAYGCKLVSLVFILGMAMDLFYGEVGNAPFSFVSDADVKISRGGIERTQYNSSRFNLIISTYMRSGSTFLGRLFSIRHDTFYVFEPLWNVQKFAFYWGKRSLCHYNENRCARQGNDAVAKDIGNSITLQESMAFLQSVLDCTFRDHKMFLQDSRHFPKDFPDLKHDWNFGKGPLWKPYFDCANIPKSNYKQCFSLMTPVCQGAPHKAMKVLRTTLNNFEPMLKSNQNLKVIHLFRDPRGILNSHMHTRFYQKKVQSVSDIENDIKTTCKRMQYDIDAALRLKRLYTDRFRIVQYEDLGDLLRKARVLYNFMELDLTPEIQRDLENLVRSENSTTGFHPYSYRTSLPWDIERAANKHCKGVFLALGYPVYKDENEYKNLDIKPESLPYALV